MPAYRAHRIRVEHRSLYKYACRHRMWATRHVRVARTRAYVHTCMHVHTHTHTHTHAHTQVYMYVRTCVRVCVRACVCTTIVSHAGSYTEAVCSSFAHQDGTAGGNQGRQAALYRRNTEVLAANVMLVRPFAVWDKVALPREPTPHSDHTAGM